MLLNRLLIAVFLACMFSSSGFSYLCSNFMIHRRARRYEKEIISDTMAEYLVLSKNEYHELHPKKISSSVYEFTRAGKIYDIYQIEQIDSVFIKLTIRHDKEEEQMKNYFQRRLSVNASLRFRSPYFAFQFFTPAHNSVEFLDTHSFLFRDYLNHIFSSPTLFISSPPPEMAAA